MQRYKTAKKDIRRSIRGSFSRFFAIFAIVALGAGFYAGLNATAPDMRATVQQYCDDSRLMDIELLSTFGFTADDVAAIRRTQGVEAVMAGYQTDVLSLVDGKEQVFRIHSLPADTSAQNADYLNRPALVQGRLPQNDQECLLGLSKLDMNLITLGSKIVLEDKDGTLSDTLRYKEYTVVGLVNSAYYLSFTLGSSAIGSGTISHYMYVPATAFSSEVYTDVHALAAGAAALDCFTQAYDDAVDPVIRHLEDLAPTREQLRYDSIRKEAQQKITDAEAALADARNTADEELQSAYARLTDAEQGLQDGEAQLSAKSAELASARVQLDAGAADLAAQESSYAAAKSQYDSLVSAYQNYPALLAQWQAGDAQYQAALAGYNAVLAAYRQQYPAAADDQLAALPSDPNDPASAALGAVKQQLDATAQTLTAQKAQLDAMAQGLAGIDQTTLDASAAQLAGWRTQLDAAAAKLAAGRAQADSGSAALGSARQTLAQSKKEVADGWSDYREAKSAAETRISDAEAEISDAKDKLADLEKPVWYVLSRHTNVGFASFEADADRMGSLSTVFPVLFFLVAALVALTTMTRMVEEERVIIGTYKALGYGNGRIIVKYLLYALLASILGAAVGVCIGFVTLPVVCYNSYRLLYTAPDLDVQFNWKYALEGTLASLVCTLGATYAACRSSLRESTAALLQPKAPKPGRRILLERIPFLWKRLNFTQKVTCRNMFRYKKRLIMTLVGIAGCTGLLLTGFGIKNSISDILHNQYDELYRYDTVLTLDGDTVSDKAAALLADPQDFSGYLVTSVKSAELTCGEKTVQGYTLVPQGTLTDFINLRERRSGKTVPFGEKEQVVLTEKAAKQLGIGVGGTVSLKNKDGKVVSFTVTGIAENYIYHYLYISPALYEEKMGYAPEYNEVVAKCALAADDDAGRTALLGSLLDAGGIATASYTSELSDKFDNMIRSLDYIVLVLIVCAGALSFVVVYNLTNINITERRRELATIKVLGFHRREVCNYIFRETNLLTVLGAFIGMFAGTVMHAYVITTVEVDIVMFGRVIAPWSYAVSFVLTCLFSLFVNLFMRKRISAIDMVESLKSVD